jgi:hypothetical protein
MTELVAMICLAFGFCLGWLLRAVFVMAAISRQQERMQRVVRYWQSEAIYARRQAERYRRQLAAVAGDLLGPDQQDDLGDGPQDNWPHPHEPI